jgi:uncharacterized membrane protein YccC
MHALREIVRLAPGRPAIKLGVRTALATAAPLCAAPWLPPESLTWAVLGGFSVSLADKGGSYATRARTMGGVALGAAVGVVIATAASRHALAAVPVMLVWATMCGFAGVLGPAAAGPGTSVAVQFAVALAWPAPAAAGVARALGVLGGGAIAMLLALFLWPVRVYRPARFAVARCYRALAERADAAHQRGAPEGGYGAVRAALESARGVLAATRLGRFGESGRGARLLVLLQIADLLSAAQVALEALLDGADAALAASVARPLAEAAAALRRVADGVETERRVPPPAHLVFTLEGVPEHPAALLERMRGYLELAAETVATLYDQRPLSPPWPAPDAEPAGPSLLERVRDNLSFESVLARHALRVGTTAAAATAVGHALGLERGYWVTVTVLIVLQPYTPATLVKALQRVAGTVLGGLVAALLVTVVRDARVVLVIVGVLAGVSAAILQLNYALYSFLLTPTFVLLAEMNAHDWRLAEVRIANTLLGGALAFAGARLLWPHKEERRIPEEMAAALLALAGYLDAVVRVIVDDVPPPAPPLGAARRRLGLAANGADASFQRLLAEGNASAAEREAIMTMLLYVRRVGATLGAAASARTVVPTAAYAGAVADLGRSAGAALDDLADAVRRGRPPAPVPAIEALAATVASPLVAARIARLAQQLQVLHHAAARWRAA